MGDEAAIDGRHRRSQRSRERILHALAEAISEAQGELTPEQIAVRSGYSMSTVLRQFGNQEGLRAAMDELIRTRVEGHLAAGPFEGDVRERAHELVRRLVAAFETLVPFERTMARSGRRDAVGLRHVDRAIRAQTSTALSSELSSLPAEAVEILAALLSLPAWSHMRTTQRRSRKQAAEIMRAGVLRVLGEEP